MSTATRLEAPLVVVPDEVLFRVRYPHTVGTWYEASLEDGFYPHRQAAYEALTGVFSAQGVPVYFDEAFTSRTTRIQTSGDNFDVEFSPYETTGNTTIRQWLGIGGDFYNQSVVSGVSTASIYLDCPPYDESYYIDLLRSASVSDNGRVGASLIQRGVGYTCTIEWDLDEHAEMETFWPWVLLTRKLTIHRRFNKQSSAATLYVANPLLGDLGFKLLYLDNLSEDSLDSPTQEPNVWGHRRTISGVIYGI